MEALREAFGFLNFGPQPRYRIFSSLLLHHHFSCLVKLLIASD